MSASPLAKSTRPRLSDTDSSARRTCTSAGLHELVDLAGFSAHRCSPASGCARQGTRRRPRSASTARGSSRCSTACTCASIAAMSRAYGSSNASCRRTGPLSTPSSTKWTVTPMTPHAVVQRLPDGAHPGERGQQRRVDVHDPALETADERPAQDLHEPGQHQQVDAVVVQPVAHARRRARRGRGGRTCRTPPRRCPRPRRARARARPPGWSPRTRPRCRRGRGPRPAAPGGWCPRRTPARRRGTPRLRPPAAPGTARRWWRSGPPRSARPRARGCRPGACATRCRRRAGRRRSCA